MNWDEVIVYALGCLAIEQSREVPTLLKSRKLQKLGMACMQQGGWALWESLSRGSIGRAAC